MMKTVHISTGITGGGAGIAALRLHRSLMKHADIQSEFVQRFPVDPEFAAINNIYTANTGRSFMIRALKRYNLHAEHFHRVKLNKYPPNYEIATFATTSYRLEQLPIIKEADIIHLHWVSEFLNYPTFFKNVKQPVVWTLHDINPFAGMFHFESDRLKNMDTYKKPDEQTRKIKTRSINRKDNIHIVCLSEWMKKKSEASEALGRYPHYLIPNGLDLSDYPVMDKTAAKQKAGVNCGLKTFIIVGAQLGNIQKGFPLFFDTVNKMNRSDFQLISIGRLPDNLKVGNNINHIHFEKITEIPELNSLYSAADLTIIPSLEDNLPNVMLESFANGVPVMSFSNGGMAEHVKTGENGIRINETGVKPLMQSLEDFLDNKYAFDSKAIRDYAVNTFSDTLQTERYIRLYKDISNNKR
ncbi:MAG: glycosyltransferase [Prevotella sp.]|jgi:glycosyltransferase involved in cell wall biosynthesis|nr:glycosyltransferase [Prevotella sp.]